LARRRGAGLDPAASSCRSRTLRVLTILLKQSILTVRYSGKNKADCIESRNRSAFADDTPTDAYGTRRSQVESCFPGATQGCRSSVSAVRLSSATANPRCTTGRTVRIPP